MAAAIILALAIVVIPVGSTGAFASSGSSVLTPSTGSESISGGAATVDYSNASEGYIMASYSGSTRGKLQITKSGGTTYTYDLRSGYEVFPLTAGSGTYTVNAFENVHSNQYALLAGTSISVSLRNDQLPFLYPNQYVSFNSGSDAVALGAQLAAGETDPLKVVSGVYNWVTQNITYDTDKAAKVQSGSLTGYLPNVDSILASRKGICFDYASLMAAMLRSQGIPTRLQVGYVSGGLYHAWLSVFTTDTGWINHAIYFDGARWTLMDPTFAAGSGQNSDAVMQFIGDGTNYSAVYIY
jgi:transglutaminase-like putative cysteine protease